MSPTISSFALALTQQTVAHRSHRTHSFIYWVTSAANREGWGVPTEQKLGGKPGPGLEARADAVAPRAVAGHSVVDNVDAEA